MKVLSGDNQAQTVVPIAYQAGTGVVTRDVHDVKDPHAKFLPIQKQRPVQVLVVSSEPEDRRVLTAILNREGWDTICASQVSECREVLAGLNISLVFCDRRLPDGAYRDVLAITRSLSRNVRLVVTSRLADWDEYLEALRYGAFELIVSPCRRSDVVWALLQSHREDEERAASSPPGKARAAAAGHAAV
jgi:DNA-binding NtrC family response regulator